MIDADTEVAARIRRALPFVGSSGSPIAALAVVHHGLRYFGSPLAERDWGSLAESEEMRWFVTHVLDCAGFIECGTSPGHGWLSDFGAQTLAVLDADEPFGYCTLDADDVCVHGYIADDEQHRCV